MRRATRVLGAVVAAVLAVGATAAADDDRSLTGETLERAAAAALAHTGGGEVVETETGDDGAAYGVEVRLPDGREVEVLLDADLTVIGEEADDDSGADVNDD